MSVAERTRLPHSILFAYGLPGLPAATIGLPLLIYLPTFYAETMGLGLTVVGGVLVVARIWDAVSDPIIGWASDRTRSRWGRRRPWLLAGLPLLLAATWHLYLPPPSANWMYLLTWTMLAYLAWTMVALSHQAWGVELSDDYHERSRVMAARETCIVLGTIGAVALPTLLPLIGHIDAGRSSEAEALRTLAWLNLALLPATGLLTLAIVPEYPPPARRAPPEWRRKLRILTDNQPFRRLLLSYFLNGIANALPATLVLLFVGHALALPGAAGAFLLAYFICGVAGIPMWLYCARRIGKHRTWCGAMLWACAAFAVVPLLGPGDYWPFLAICIATGVGLGADLALPPSMQADVVDVDTLAVGEERTGLYFALWAMTTKLSYALGVGLTFPLLDWIGFAPEGESTPLGLAGLAVLYGWAPIAFKLAAVALMWNFPLDAALQSALRRQIEERRSCV